MATLQEPQSPPQARRRLVTTDAAHTAVLAPAYLHDWEPGAPLDRALPGRIDHQLLGGKDGLRGDRTAAEQLSAAVPGFAESVRARRRFVERALCRLVREEHIREVLVLGAGLPSLPHLHEVVQAEDPRGRVVYVDHDPIVLSHLRAKLTCQLPGRLAVVRGHLRDPQQLLDSGAVRSLLAAGQPVALVLESALEFISDEEDPRLLVAELMKGLPRGSWLVLLHATADFAPSSWQTITEIYRSHGIKIYPRSLEQIAAFMDRMLLAAPGLVAVNQWYLDERALAELGDAAVSRYGAIARLSVPAAGAGGVA
ncbi:SAM-dependent methyltransferase [Kitasatospora sp. NBC_01287]|uniref:SAM-dependent methyltransferase n=1 Tax=Kitasatospora sp. NBC_01287 TaxID=2903573 RepID=UPI002255E9A7|nr:SAM-dependent methyltransferase [Kitasatospora sp. NBC_01287]MCX4751166.1 SAM-dependent methyltransferase [Kitasatospora sp. NBC_01287]